MKKFLDSQMLMAFSCEGKESSYCIGIFACASSPPFARREDGDSEKRASVGSGPFLLICLASVDASIPHLPACIHSIQLRSEMLWSRLGFACTAPDTEGTACSFKAKHRRLFRAEPNPRSASREALPADVALLQHKAAQLQMLSGPFVSIRSLQTAARLLSKDKVYYRMKRTSG